MDRLRTVTNRRNYLFFFCFGGFSMNKIEKMARMLAESDQPEELKDALELCRALEREDSYEVQHAMGETELIYDDANFQTAHAIARKIRGAAGRLAKSGGGQEMLDLYYDCHLFDAPYWFDSFCIYIEKDREPQKQFYVPRRKQLLECTHALQDLEDGVIDLLGISEPPGVGKALADDTPVLTKNGWKNHGDLVIGDEVIGLDGKFKKVIWVRPKCMLDVMVEFTNGEKIQCHENHEWMVHDRSGARDYIAETKVFEKRVLEYGGEPGTRGHRYILQMPSRSAVEGEEKDLPLDPYTFGAWLGDGANKNPRICNAKADYAIIERIIKNGHEVRWKTEHKKYGVWYYDFDIRRDLQSMGLCHSRKICQKRIPVEYLTASVNQRLQLMAGLIDTDGTLTGSKFNFTTSEETLRDSFLDLLATFGWHGCVTKHEPSVSSSGIAAKKPWYCIGFTPDLTIPCALERKVNHDPHPQRKIAIKSITRVEPKQGNCITVEGDGMYLAGKTLIPTHNTTLAEFFLAWQCGKHPDLANLIGSHNNSFLNGVYGEMLRILDRHGEYRWGDVFPHLQIINTNARNMMIDVGRDRKDSKRFMTLEFSSIGSGNAGKVRAQNLLYCDDLVDGIETAMSRDRLDKLWQMYTVDLRQRKLGNCRELHIATRWSLYDPIGRLEREYEGDERARFIRFSALDENDESNFDYPHGLGYTTEVLHRQRDMMDDASWRALYCNQPIERSGVLYDPNEIRRYFCLPEREPDAIIAVCDTKEQGPDYCTMPILYQYGRDYYVDFFLCDNGKVEILEERVARLLYERKVKLCQFESNRGGTIFAQNVQERLQRLGGMTTITTKWTQTNKSTRIQVNSPFVKTHFLFKDESLYNGVGARGDKEYRTAMNFMFSYSMAGKNKFDDVVDVLSLSVEFIRRGVSTRAEVFQRPW